MDAYPEIPVLARRREEKKGGGALFFLNAPGGAGSTGWAARTAAWAARCFGGPQTFLGGAFQGPLGAGLVKSIALVGAGSAALLALAGAASHGGDSRPGFRTGMIQEKDLRAAASRKGGSEGLSLSFVAGANRGEIRWEGGGPISGKGKSPEGVEEKGTEAPAAVRETAGESAPAVFPKRLAPLSLGGRQDWASAGGGGLRDGLAGFELTKSYSPAPMAPGKIKAFSSGQGPTRGLRAQLQRSRATRAMGQLKFSVMMSKSGNTAREDSKARQREADAFDGKYTGGEGIMELGGSIAVSPSFSAPGQAPLVEAKNVTPYQPKIDAAKNLGNTAGALKAAGVGLIVAGSLLIALGIALLNCTTFPIGLLLIAIGTAMLATGIGLIAMGANMAAQGRAQAQNVGQQDGQAEQQDRAQSCVDKAFSLGISVEEACPNVPDARVDPSHGNTVRQDVLRESQATYSLH